MGLIHTEEWPARRCTTLQDAEAHVNAMPVGRHREQAAPWPYDFEPDHLTAMQRQAADEQMQSRAFHARMAMADTEDAADEKPETGWRSLLTPAGWFFVPYFIGLAAVAAWLFTSWR